MTVIPAESSVKLLGVHIDYSLCFNEHISETCKKAGRKLNVLRRLSNVFGEEEKLKMFQAFIVSHFNLCPLVWHCCSTTNAKKIETLQERALRFVYNDFVSSYSDLRAKANRPLMYVQRLRYMMTEVYKIINKEGPTYLHGLFSIKETCYNTRDLYILEQPKDNTVKYGFNSITYQGARLWNFLDDKIKQCNNIQDFKYLITKWQGPNCNCANCIVCNMRYI